MRKKFWKKINNYQNNHINSFDEYESIVGEPLFSTIELTIDHICKIKPSISDDELYNTIIKLANICLKNNTTLYYELNSSEINYLYSIDGGNTAIQNYFNDVSNVYNNDNFKDVNNIELNSTITESDKKRLIKSNLKLVIAIAKKYKGCGLTFEELISAGNLGLCIAIDKYDLNKSTIKKSILEKIETQTWPMNKYELLYIFEDDMTYGKLKEDFIQSFDIDGDIKKEDVILWIKENIKIAKFSSVAAMWINSYIIQEIENTSRIVKKPKTEINKDKEKTGKYIKETIVNIDNNTDEDDQFSPFIITDNVDNAIDELIAIDNYNEFKKILSKILYNIKGRDKRIILKRFGIGVIEPMLPKDIANDERISIARVSQIIQNTLNKMQENAIDLKIKKDDVYNLIKKIK